MHTLFETTKINGLSLANRFVRSATWEGKAADDGAVSTKLISTMADLAQGGVGLVITGHTYVQSQGQASPRQLGIYKDELVTGLQEMTKTVHDCGGKIVAQLAHAGAFAPQAITGQLPLVVSRLQHPDAKPGREITHEDLRELVAAFAAAARRAKAAGFDGIQIHSAHGYLLSQFLSPIFNRRQDDYGGDISNRSRILLEVYRAIREAVGQNYPILVKLNCQDFAEDGLTLQDSLEVGRMLAAAGLDAIEVSGGLLTNRKLSPSRVGIKSVADEAYFQEEARQFKKAVPIPVILVGGIRSFTKAAALVDEGAADYISMSRPFIREPGLINRWKTGDFEQSACKSDNLCFRTGMSPRGVYCETEEKGV